MSGAPPQRWFGPALPLSAMAEFLAAEPAASTKLSSRNWGLASWLPGVEPEGGRSRLPWDSTLVGICVCQLPRPSWTPVSPVTFASITGPLLRWKRLAWL